MKHIPITGKFLTIMAGFGLFSLGTTLYSSQQTFSIDETYSALLSNEQSASLDLARSNRSLQATRSSIGDLFMSRTAEANEAAEKELAANKASFVTYMDKVIAALPSRTDLGKLKSDGLAIIDTACVPTINAARAATAETDIE